LVQIRKATIEDIQIIVHQRTEMVRSMGWSDDMISATKAATLEFLQQPWNPSIECYLETDEDRVVGGCAVSFCIAYPSAMNTSGKFAYLYNMFIEPDFRGKGIATSLLKHITLLCQEKGIAKLALHDTKMSKGIYEKQGFVRSENYYIKIIPE
jgi:GNAT superfamily N-acetyltransferase